MDVMRPENNCETSFLFWQENKRKGVSESSEIGLHLF